MANNRLTTQQIELTFIGVNQIIKAISTLKKKAEKDAEKAEIKTKLDSISDDFIKGHKDVAPLYRLDKVKTALNLSLDKVDSIYTIANKRSAISVQKEIEKLRKQKETIESRIKELEKELLGK
jgi:benzoyl-CoA reductase/2-hydroxyglutaryl-CoA dehydratase subunit BcrC/BadD/HgdB